ncbi:L-carnitine dehydratase/bile acid-inducible protein F [Thecamonas trahens ATCC 50062]|uniref:L-carnitine dehydratase/bile acid-inducible protein F n=1 Tax=Thecamonas trahens ATCC 50062 TaxID=461836 RepID=A0A0L0DCJ6_THETB|nr:L-carnitine dehydratase/bile acid-inducible protein F [Thecamonas trahens ATCC 50062]KNC50057.1 L-carnitine dehydratase/bile acid-inducible protein F [Thecamonas trahens ATCC 50062]|eukprot:XP_013757222.1 L-carnitine dehydratase/bile acid-inducible protein F [Thecamonas trahens ATCC 50062]
MAAAARRVSAASASSAAAGLAHGPLEGIRVLDLSRILAGPYCTMMLGDLGAEVIKVEAVAGGDPTRKWGPPFAERIDDTDEASESAYFLCVNRNKSSIAVDFKSERGVALIKALAAVSDVVVENFVPGKLAQLGLDFDSLAPGNTRGGLIYASITGFGPDGPLATRAGYDVIAAGMGGLMGITGEADGPPVKVGVAITDIATGMLAQGAISSALLARERGLAPPEGQKVDLSLFETQLACLVNIGSNYLIGGKNGKRWGTAHESIVPYQAFPTADDDGYIIVGATTDAQFAKLAAALHDELPQLADAPELFGTNALRVAHREELVGLLSSFTAIRTTAECEAFFASLGLATGPINSMDEAFANPQVAARDMVATIDHPTAGPVSLVGLPVKYSATPGSIRLPPPLHGEHTRSVLESTLNLSAAEIDQLIADAVVKAV